MAVRIMSRRRLTEEERDLTAKHVGLAHYWAKRYFSSARDYNDEQDIIGASLLGLCQATLTYRPELGFKFITYASHYCKREIRKALADRRLVRTPPKNKAIKIRTVGATALRALVDPAPGPVERAEWAEAIEAIRKLPAQERAVLERVRAGDTLAEIGRSLGLKRSRINQIKMAGIRRLSRRFSAAG
jgi:RNA polymerase sigma factor (sigma-70 family)